ncbi:ubiquitin [Lactobacillus helveticus]|uniref:Ubiquitin n=2 Tax=Lactobacillus helveticus TaxID=1587 RepID=A0AAU8XWA7_LACHE|nr:hypothetical protein [Lactobacillus helveticus]ANZ56387.1 ubiquitin [Lactobacillus helveticus]AQY52818.1 ubiquitin [Lactobacillus helveticus]AUI75073.1 ubiquitin [Lactobacillus helveticus]AUI76969.1 ubiquitin [Lactobacillus helveticus]MBU5981516.1 ubiquitin [Lactobacillus helveticus]
MKKVVLIFKVLLGLIPFLPLLVDAIFKTNIRTSIMNITMQWSLWLKIPFLIMCILAYMYFWYALFKEIKDSL